MAPVLALRQNIFVFYCARLKTGLCDGLCVLHAEVACLKRSKVTNGTLFALIVLAFQLFFIAIIFKQCTIKFSLKPFQMTWCSLCPVSRFCLMICKAQGYTVNHLSGAAKLKWMKCDKRTWYGLNICSLSRSSCFLDLFSPLLGCSTFITFAFHIFCHFVLAVQYKITFCFQGSPSALI